MTVKMAQFKSWAMANLESNHPLRDLILSEREEISDEEFKIMAKRWVRLLHRAS